MTFFYCVGSSKLCLLISQTQIKTRCKWNEEYMWEREGEREIMKLRRYFRDFTKFSYFYALEPRTHTHTEKHKHKIISRLCLCYERTSRKKTKCVPRSNLFFSAPSIYIILLNWNHFGCFRFFFIEFWKNMPADLVAKTVCSAYGNASNLLGLFQSSDRNLWSLLLNIHSHFYHIITQLYARIYYYITVHYELLCFRLHHGRARSIH